MGAMSARRPNSTAPAHEAAAEGAHDHSGCAHDPARLGGLTLGRRQILDALCAEGKPLGAYELIDRVMRPNGKRPAPISVYRALEFLVEKGLVHRLASRNAYLACRSGHDVHAPVVFLLCTRCGAADEAVSPDLSAHLAALARGADFSATSQAVELVGLCARCRSE